MIRSIEAVNWKEWKRYRSGGFIFILIPKGANCL